MEKPLLSDCLHSFYIILCLQLVWLDLTNLQEQVEKQTHLLFGKLYWPFTVGINSSSDLGLECRISKKSSITRTFFLSQYVRTFLETNYQFYFMFAGKICRRGYCENGPFSKCTATLCRPRLGERLPSLMETWWLSILERIQRCRCSFGITSFSALASTCVTTIR